jgi:hypothetical protein
MSRTSFALMAVAAALSITACSSSHKAAVATPTTAPHQVPATAPSTAATPPATAATAAVAATNGGLSGNWSGHYSGAFSGTFTLNWTQSGSALTGTIDLNPGGTVNIQGAVQGGSIRFGTLGNSFNGMGITYSGSVAGSSMSGAYHVTAPNKTYNGSWNASRS